MKLTSYLIAGAVGVLFIANTASAQDSTAQTITYDEAIELAIDNSINLEKEKNNMKVSEAIRRQSLALFLPDANVSFSASRNIGLQFNETTGQLTSETTEGFSGGISVGLPLFNGLRRIYTAQQSKSGVQQQVFTIERARQDAIYNVSVQYLEVLVNQELLEIAQADLKRQQDLLASIQAYFDAGTKNIADLYNQEAETKRVELTVVEAQNNLNLSKANLLSSLQVDPFVNWNFERPAIEMGDVLTKTLSIEDFYNEAIDNRPDYKQQKKLIDYNEKSVKIAKSYFYPSLTAGYNFGSAYSSLSPNTFSDQFRDFNRSTYYGLQLNIPIFNNLINTRNVQQYRQQYNNSQLDLEDLERTIFTEAQKVISDFATAQQRVITTESQLRSAEKALEVEEERFRLGTGKLDELNDASAAYVSAKSNNIQAEYTIIFQETYLKYFKGIL